IKYWTVVPISNEFAASIISQYLEVDHPTLGFFDADLFIHDLVYRRLEFCSPLLVSSLLYWAVHSYSFIDANSSTMSAAFFAEAKMLWKAERESDSPTTAAALLLLGLGTACNGNDDDCISFNKEAEHICRRLGYFSEAQPESHFNVNIEASRFKAHVAWGTWSWSTIRSMIYHLKPPPNPPKLPRPGSHGWLLPSYMGMTFASLLDFNVINHEVAMVYVSDDPRPIVERVPLAFAEAKYQKLLQWADGLPAAVVRREQNDHHVLDLHVYFHALIMDIFRPFLSQRLSLQTFASRTSTPDAIFDASLNQLRRLVLVYRSTQKAAAYHVCWTTGIVYVAHAMLARHETDKEWKFYFLACIYALQDLYISFRLFSAIIQGLLTMAVRDGCMTGHEARSIRKSLQERGGHHQTDNAVKASFMIDMDLAIRNKIEDAKVEKLAEKFDEMVAFDDLVSTDGDQSSVSRSA
ncbi:MAG: hypothetical protein FE78DRAFT_148967, partial [Acidomyces sp. 'richmondensis']